MHEPRAVSLLSAILALSMAHGPSRVCGQETPSDAPPDARARLAFFESEVRPLLAERCFRCHGPDRQRSGLRLDSGARARAGGESGPAIEPGSPEDSLLMEAVRYESFEMPPDGQLAAEEIEILEAWIRAGAIWPGDPGLPVPEARDDAVEGGFSAEERAWWAFQPPRDPAVPDAAGDWATNEIDRFVWQRMAVHGLEPAPEATRVELIRRLSFDLRGLPPTREEVRAFVEDSEPDAYERLVDQMLDSPHYGERWGRIWLDLIRYAESDGFKQDAYRPDAWRFRDYVVRSFNDDKPYNQFVLEQLAGDEWNPDDPDALVATGFLRLGIYEYNQRDVRTQWNDMLNEVTDVTADVFLGVGLRCARCHDHKFDPLLQDDYFRLRAFFEPLMLRDDAVLAPSSQQEAYRRQMAAWESATRELQQELEALEEPHRQEVAHAAIEKFPLDIRPLLRKSPEERTPEEHQLAELAYRQIVEEYNKLDMTKRLQGEELEHWRSLQDALAEAGAERPEVPPTAPTVCDVGPVAPPTRIPGEDRVIPPGYLTILDPDPAAIEKPGVRDDSTGRRLTLARWLTRPDHPLTTRVIVNRLWQHHFGRGLVATTSDFGRLGEPPSHPELLDWLAVQFVRDGWSLKQLHRRMVTSSTYRQSSRPPAGAPTWQADPDNRWLARMPIRRLDAEQIRDAALAVSGELDLTRGGPSVSWESSRRSIYLRVMRNAHEPLLHVFDAPDHISPTSRRNVTTTPIQSLTMINGPWMLARANAMARRLERETETTEELVDEAWLLVTGRRSTDAERQQSLAFLERQVATHREAAPAVPRTQLENGYAANLHPSPDQPLLVTGPDALPAMPRMSVSARVLLRSIYEDASVRTIVSQWNSNAQSPGWSLGVTSARSRFRPLNVILQIVGNDANGELRYEVVASDLHLQLDRLYDVGVILDLTPTGEDGVRFVVRDVESGTVRTSQVMHPIRSIPDRAAPLALGGRFGSDGHRWDGLLDNVLVAAARLEDGDLLEVDGGDERTAAVAWWTFENDGTTVGPELRPADRPVGADPMSQAVVDLCHVLLNSNPFLYVD